MIRLLSRLFLFALLSGTSFILMSCDTIDCDCAPSPYPSFDNSFSVMVTDSTGAAISLEGFSYFATGQYFAPGRDGVVVQALYFVDEDEESFSQNRALSGLFGLAMLKEDSLGVGNYPVSNDEKHFDEGSAFAMVLYENLDSQAGTIYSVTGGDLRITESEGNRVDGSFNLTAVTSTSADSKSGQTVTIKGTFRSLSINASLFGTDLLKP